MNEEEFLRNAIRESLALKERFFEQNTRSIVELSNLLLKLRTSGRKAILFGNGGSAADAQHFAAELMHRVEKISIGIRALALHTDTSLLTAIGNDEGFSFIYARQIDVIAEPDDVAIGISTSGNSTNIIEGLKMARVRRCVTVGLLGRDGGAASNLCDLAIVVPHHSTPRIQEVHGMIIHLVCQLLESH